MLRGKVRTGTKCLITFEMHKNTVHMFLKKGMLVIQPFQWIGMQNTNLLIHAPIYAAGFLAQ